MIGDQRKDEGRAFNEYQEQWGLGAQRKAISDEVKSAP